MRTRITLLEHADGLRWCLEWHGPNGSGNLETDGYTAFAYAARLVTGAQGPVPLEPLPGDWQTAREIRLHKLDRYGWRITEGSLYSQALDPCECVGMLAFVLFGTRDPSGSPLYVSLQPYLDHLQHAPWLYPRAGQQYLPEREGVATDG